MRPARRRRAAGLLLAATAGAAVLLTACSATPREDGAAGDLISRERAIEIARGHLDFAAQTTEAERTTLEGQRVWRVTFRGRPALPNQVTFEVLIVYVDRQTGEVVSIAMS